MKRRWGVLVGLAALLAGCGGGSSTTTSTDKASGWSAEAEQREAANESLARAVEQPRGRTDGAYEFCVEQITRQLKAPATAQFSERDPAHEGHDGDYYLFTGTVDSQNTFGALLRSNWACDIRWTGSEYIAETASVA